jgi:hypothetical protein
MNISENLEYMLETLANDRLFLYKRRKLPDRVDEDTNKVYTNRYAWEKVHRFFYLPYDLIKLSQYPFIFTPNFDKYIDLNADRSKFIIRDTLNKEKEIMKIPRQLLDGTKEKIPNLARRFKWIDSKRFHVINNQGIERIIKIDFEKFECNEVEFNVIPLYNPEYCLTSHYLCDPPSYTLE